MIKTFKTKEQFNQWAKDLPSGVMCFIEDTNEVIFRTNNIDGTDTLYECDAAAIEDNLELLESGNIITKKTKFKKVTYKGRAYKNGVAVPFSLPFEISMTYLLDQFGTTDRRKIYYIKDATPNELTKQLHLNFFFREREDDIVAANTPLIVIPLKEIAADEELVFYDVVIDPNAPKVEFDLDGCFTVVPTCTSTITFPPYSRYINGSGNFAFSSTKSVDIKPYRFAMKATDKWIERQLNGWTIIF